MPCGRVTYWMEKLCEAGYSVQLSTNRDTGFLSQNNYRPGWTIKVKGLRGCKLPRFIRRREGPTPESVLRPVYEEIDEQRGI